jgi:two-component system, cell cycle sensor histidine kinase and response regulator CckA
MGGIDVQTILVLDDEPVVLRVITAVLQREGYVVLESQTASEVQRLATEYAGQIDLLIADHELPNTTGRAVADAIRRVRPRIRFLEISGHNKVQLEDEGELTSESAFLQKPFSPGKLLEAVRETLNARD